MSTFYEKVFDCIAVARAKSLAERSGLRLLEEMVQPRQAKMKMVAALVGFALSWSGMQPAAAEPCITIVIHKDDRLGFRNACDLCKRAVWSWGAGQSFFSRNGKVEGVWQGGETWTRKYRVPPRGEITVQEEAPIGKLLREEPCPPPAR